MALGSLGRPLAALGGVLAMVGALQPAQAYLYWKSPAIAGAVSTGMEPGLAVALPGATPKEAAANMLWAMRAGLNVAALQCQFAPALMTVGNYNALLRQHGAELQDAYAVLSGYFKRTGGKAWQTALDQFTTRTYNGFSTMYAQMSFCETAATIGRDAMRQPRGKLGATALERIREFRNSLIPVGDAAFGVPSANVGAGRMIDLEEQKCFDKKGRQKACKT